MFVSMRFFLTPQNFLCKILKEGFRYEHFRTVPICLERLRLALEELGTMESKAETQQLENHKFSLNETENSPGAMVQKWQFYSD